MKKRIYKSDNRRSYKLSDQFYQPHEFNRYMREQGAEIVVSIVGAREANSNQIAVYSLNDITVKHIVLPNARVASMVLDVEVWLFGSLKKVGKLEKMMGLASKVSNFEREDDGD